MPLTLIYSVSATTLGFGFCLDLFCPRTVSPFIGCETPLRDQYSFDCNFSVLACVLGCTCRDKPSWRGHSCDTGDNQRSSGVVIARSRSFGALDHQRRDLHFNRLYLTSRKIRPNPLSSGISYQVSREVYRVTFRLVCFFSSHSPQKATKRFCFSPSYNHRLAFALFSFGVRSLEFVS